MFPKTRICVTDHCNLRCEYCPPSGDNYGGVKCPRENTLSQCESAALISALVAAGCRFIQFTGGEPLLEPRKLESMAKALSSPEGVSLGMTTNGCLIRKRLDLLRHMQLSYIMVSVDTLRREKFARITGEDRLVEVLAGIREAREFVKVRLNCVVTNRNKDEIWNMIDFCAAEKVDLKLIDLNFYADPGSEYWTRAYYDLDTIISELRVATDSHRPAWNFAGKTGIPMIAFSYDGITITIKNSKAGSHYAEACSGCPLHPSAGGTHYCQEGLYDMYITADGRLQMCKHRQDKGVNLRPHIPDLKCLQDVIQQYAVQYSRLSFVPGKLDTSWW